MAPFAGHDMPISYPTGAIEEHLVTRRSVGLFDIDHMGQVLVSGSGADEYVSRMVSAPVLDMRTWDARYSLLLDDRGLVLDDLFIYRLPGRWWIVVNASNRQADFRRFADNAPGGVMVEDKSAETYMIAVQGPRALELLDAVSDRKVSGFPRFTAGEMVIHGIKILFGRTGYTGEDGGELFFPADRAVELWTHLISEGGRLGIETKAIGLAARDSLRFEAGMPLHGHEISPAINAIEAGFSWACDFGKPDFVGKAALEAIKAAGPARKLVCIEIQGGVPREGYEVLAAPGCDAPGAAGDVTDPTVRIGACVAGMFCPTTRKYAANAFVASAHAKVGTPVRVLVHGKAKDGIVVKRPLYLPAYRRPTGAA